MNKELINYKSQRKSELSKWIIFITERFEPVSHFIMIALFVFAHYLVTDANNFVVVETHLIAYVTLGTALFFFKLRLYDEIKDYEVDLEKNPTRPLPRGLLGHYDVKKAIELCLIIEVILFASSGVSGFLAIAFAIGYSLLMYKEFFIPKLIRPHLTTYATSHTIVTLFLSVALFSSFSRFKPWALHKDFYLFAFLSWLSFNIFELGRKVYQPCEEREGVPTYSSIWGKFGAFMLVFIHAAAVSALILYISTVQYSFMLKLLSIQLILLLIIGIIYLCGKTKTTGNLFRKFSSIYIVLVYSSIIINYFVRGIN